MFRPSISTFPKQKEGAKMEVIKVHKRTVKNDLLGCKITLTILDVCETIKESNGTEVLNFYQIYNVREVWDVME
jgi:hypothetical protein